MQTIVQQQKRWYEEGHTKSYQFRKDQLLRMKKMIGTFEKPIIEALKFDLNKSEFEAYVSEIAFLKSEIDHHVKHLKQWMNPQKVKAPLTHKGSKNMIYKEPYGTVLVIAPWNYPFQLALAPVLGAIAAGNTVIIKPSELTPTVSWVIKKMVEQYFSPNYIAVVEGDKKVTQELMEQPLDYIFFTGSVPVGRKIMEKASHQLIPVTLELGGKSPAIINKDAAIDLAAKRIVWGKFTNAGQTCIAPDYLLVHHEVKAPLIKAMKKYIHKFYGDRPLENPDYVKIVNDQHFERISSYLNAGTVVSGGSLDEKRQMIEPTILDQVNWSDPVMQDEIFGPILPVLTFDHLSEVITQVNNRPKPLALYYFGESETDQEEIMTSIPFGGGCINDTLYHILNPHLPFGGVGESGMGSYHGQASFDTFTHLKSITKQTTKFDQKFRYPGSSFGLTLIKKVLG
ncbi:aldehyde dehydrogenase [Halobacillus halophilus]|uniref:Aldehyde dehydrogenase n=1 Tax=Halobacillus halophilus (strain ATCC 35676 / DSM 2266 / JCM 20832 / KCTC 3685 / LMG 17431 / NBRC 102448 / NCIMB 2269) TaxID=866895 RepID=I0JNQ9_HALH3|nr:aldehyde dehydrogenase [Halobacillus halophilus]ASF39825.1 aldehyde dehydrogenase [Halobacillus halophilus]CCG45779.1 aldehyde dehydrogenase [Halobacillus halophilus DSM 2266]